MRACRHRRFGPSGLEMGVAGSTAKVNKRSSACPSSALLSLLHHHPVTSFSSHTLALALAALLFLHSLSVSRSSFCKVFCHTSCTRATRSIIHHSPTHLQQANPEYYPSRDPFSCDSWDALITGALKSYTLDNSIVDSSTQY